MAYHITGREYQEEVAAYQTELIKLARAKQKAEEDYIECQAEVQKLASQRDMLRRQGVRCSMEASMEFELNRLANEVEAIREKAQSLLALCDKLRKDYQEAQDELDEIKDEERIACSKLAELKAKSKYYETTIKQLKDELAAKRQTIIRMQQGLEEEVERRRRRQRQMSWILMLSVVGTLTFVAAETAAAGVLIVSAVAFYCVGYALSLWNRFTD